MSVEPSESMREIWTSWQGYVINGVFPLGRFLGGSDHSGVFLTKSLLRDAPDVAIKLVPTNRALAELQLPRWRRAGRLPHPHLLRLLEWGGCQLEGLPYLYAVMEYADQTLAQLLQHRAMTEDEARELLLPTLRALAFLHGRNLVQGQLKPTNILVVGEELKLASDTIRRVSDGPVSTDAPTVYDPPEARYGGGSAAGDIWAFGATLFEALTRRAPSGLSEGREGVALPADFPPTFREAVACCLNPNPQDRPSVAELVAWVRGGSAEFVPTATAQPVALVVPEPVTPQAVTLEPVALEPMAPEPVTPEPVALEPMAPEPVTPEPVVLEPMAPAPTSAEPPPPQTARAEPASAAERPEPFITQSTVLRGVVPVILGVSLALIWTGVEVLKGHRLPAPPPAPVEASGAAPLQAAGTALAAAGVRAPGSAVSATKPARSDAATSPRALQTSSWARARAVRWIRSIALPTWARTADNSSASRTPMRSSAPSTLAS